jgi:hypothetical protein
MEKVVLTKRISRSSKSAGDGWRAAVLLGALIIISIAINTAVILADHGL